MTQRSRIVGRRDSRIGRRVWLGIGVAVVALTVAVLSAVHYAPRMLSGPALTTLVVQGELHHVSPQAVRAAVLPALGRGFFSTDTHAVQTAVAAVPWVAEAFVRRRWPHTLFVRITEETPMARWNGNGLVDADGRIFVHSDDTAWVKLPRLSGPEGGAPDVLAEYRSFTSLLSVRGLVIVALTVDARGASSVQLANGIQVRLGRENAEARLERFAAVAIPALGTRLADVAYVDMRYPNGFAVGWASSKPAPECLPHAAPAGRGSRNTSSATCMKDNEVHSNV